MEVVGIKKV